MQGKPGPRAGRAEAQACCIAASPAADGAGRAVQSVRRMGQLRIFRDSPNQFFPNQTRGKRPIGFMAMVYALYEQVRVPIFNKWKAANEKAV